MKSAGKGVKFERIRRITGYLVGTMDKWNDAKRAEERDRVKHGLGTNTSAPLKGICLLERGENNSIQRISGKDALFMLLQQSSRPLNAGNMPKYLELVDKISASVAFYRMQCNMELEAAEVAYGAMSQQGKEAQV